MLWRYLYNNDTNMINYMTSYVVISNIISIFYCNGIARRISDRVNNGLIALDLIKPINIFSMCWQLELGQVFSNFIIKGLPIILVYLFVLIRQESYSNIELFILAIIIGHIIFILLYSLLGFFSIVLFDIWPFQRVLDDTIRFLGGGFLPLSIMPKSLCGVVMYLPFYFLYSFPLDILFNKISSDMIFKYFLIGFLWIIVLSIINIIVYKLLIRRIVVQGG